MRRQECGRGEGLYYSGRLSVKVPWELDTSMRAAKRTAEQHADARGGAASIGFVFRKVFAVILSELFTVRFFMSVRCSLARLSAPKCTVQFLSF